MSDTRMLVQVQKVYCQLKESVMQEMLKLVNRSHIMLRLKIQI